MADTLYNATLPEVSLSVELTSEIQLGLENSGELLLAIEIDPIVRDPATLIRPFVFTQASASITWTVAHNLGYNPDVSVYSTGGAQVDANVVHVDINNLTISFSFAFAGRARLF